MSAGARQIVISSVLLLAENIVRLTAVAAVSFWIARHLGPGQFGILNFASALMAILLSVSSLGMDTPLILRLTQAQYSGVLVGTALLTRGLFSLVVFVAAVAIAFVLKGNDPLSLHVSVIVALCIIGYAPNVLDCWFKARTLATGPAVARTLATLLATGAKVICLLLGMGVVALAWTVLLEAVLATLGLYIAYRLATKSTVVDALAVDRHMMPTLIRESAPYLWSGVAILLYMKVDVVMLGYLSSNIETGIYSLAQKLSEVLYMVPVVLIDSAYPALARKSLASDRADSSHGQMLFDIAVGGSLLATVCAVMLAGPVISRVFGESYLPSVEIFYLHAWSCVAIAMNTARHNWLATASLQRYAPVVTIMGLVINVGMNIFLIPVWGAAGAAIATVVSYFASGYLSSFVFAPLRAIGWMQTRALWPWGRLFKASKSLFPRRIAA